VPRVTIVVEFSWRSLAVRLLTGSVVALAAFITLYFIPSNLSSFLAGYSPNGLAPSIASLVAALVTPTLLAIGLLITALVFVGVVVRGSVVYGPVLVATGLGFIAYFYALFQGGSVSFQIPQELVGNLSGSIVVRLDQLVLLLVLPAALAVVKGIVLLLPWKESV
jgi:hypothetical protein